MGTGRLEYKNKSENLRTPFRQRSYQNTLLHAGYRKVWSTFRIEGSQVFNLQEVFSMIRGEGTRGCGWTTARKM